MEFRQLTYFLAAAHTQNFRKAAELCLVTQPALSRQIAALEKELGTTLFKRVQQRVEITPAGLVLRASVSLDAHQVPADMMAYQYLMLILEHLEMQDESRKHYLRLLQTPRRSS